MTQIEKLQAINAKQAELIEHLTEMLYLTGYKPGQPETHSAELISIISSLQSEQGEKGGNHVHYFRDGICKICGLKMDYTNAC
jgi:hypothetical protein